MHPAAAAGLTPVTTGVSGRRWRASVMPWGAVAPWDGTSPLNWFVAADDRWHVPESEPSVRQQRIEGTPVTETRVRVPHGDVVQTIYSCADAGGVTVIEIVNESTLPAAIAFDRRDVLTERAIADIPIEGIDLPAGSFVLPLGHRARLRVGIAHDVRRAGALPAGLSSAAQVVGGWRSITDRASRFVLPDGELGSQVVARVTSARCELVLRGLGLAGNDPVAFALGSQELVRMGERPEGMLEELAAAVHQLARTRTWEADVALAAAARTLTAAGEKRARRDLDRIIGDRGRDRTGAPELPPDGVAVIPWLESRIAIAGALFPHGLPGELLGQSIEAHRVPTGVASSVSLAVRWHGARPAVLWEQQGTAIELSAPVLAPGWASSQATGDALWPPPVTMV